MIPDIDTISDRHSNDPMDVALSNPYSMSGNRKVCGYEAKLFQSETSPRHLLFRETLFSTL